MFPIILRGLFNELIHLFIQQILIGIKYLLYAKCCSKFCGYIRKQTCLCSTKNEKKLKINQKLKCIVPQTISAMERSKPAKRDRASQGWGGGVGLGEMFKDVLRLRFIRKVTSEQSSEGVAHAALQGKGAPARGKKKQKL